MSGCAEFVAVGFGKHRSRLGLLSTIPAARTFWIEALVLDPVAMVFLFEDDRVVNQSQSQVPYLMICYIL